MMLMVDVALLLWTSVGSAVERSRPQVCLPCKRKGARLSLVRVEAYYWREVTRRTRLTLAFVQQNLPPPRIRSFQWLTQPQK